jgi:hypothetical protein
MGRQTPAVGCGPRLFARRVFPFHAGRTNKANGRLHPPGRGLSDKGRCTDKPNRPGSIVQKEANSGSSRERPRSPRAEMRETNPIGPRTLPSRVPDEAKGVKRTQFPAGPARAGLGSDAKECGTGKPSLQRPEYPSFSVWYQGCGTNAISRLRMGDGPSSAPPTPPSCSEAHWPPDLSRN